MIKLYITLAVLIVILLMIVVRIFIYRRIQDEEPQSKKQKVTESESSESDDKPKPSKSHAEAPKQQKYKKSSVYHLGEKGGAKLDTKVKKKLYIDTAALEYNNFDAGKYAKCEKLEMKGIDFEESEVNEIDKKIVLGRDSIAEIFRCMKQYTNVAANTAANPTYLGGSFTVSADKHNGSGSQEEAMMTIIDGLASSLIVYEEDQRSGTLYCPNRDKRQKYAKYTFVNNTILVTRDLHPRIQMELFDDYIADNKNFDKFAIYVAYRNGNEDVLLTDEKYTTDIYTIPALKRSSVDILDYDKLRKDIFVRIAKMLIHAASLKREVVVVTIPGSGSFSKDRKNQVDLKYLKSVEEGTIAAIRKYGGPFKEIVLCGNRN